MTSDRKRRWKFAALSAAALAAVVATAHSGTDSLLYVIDFEGLDENTAISNQYEEFGVTFAIEGRPDLSPIITVDGMGAATAFFSASGADANMSSGIAGLTDPPMGGDYFAPNDIRMQFDPPVTLVSFYLIDIDGAAPAGDAVTVTAFDGAAAVDSTTVVGTLANDGKSVKVTLAGGSITSVLVDVTPNATSGLIGWALDFVSVARPCPSPQCTPRFRLSQESAPGAGDFGSHILGEVPLWSAVGTSAAAFYGYGVPESASWNGAALALEADRSHLFGAVTADEVTLFMVHDRAEPDNPNGGSAELIVEALDDASQAAFLVQDDPTIDESTDFYTGLPGSGLFTARQKWGECCSDGIAIGKFKCGESMIVQFAEVDNNVLTPPIASLNTWVAYGATGEQLSLVLELDRRVRVDVLPPANCAADLTCDGLIGAADLAVLIGAWGPNGGAPDINGSGAVDATDLAQLLGTWGQCGGK